MTKRLCDLAPTAMPAARSPCAPIGDGAIGGPSRALAATGGL